MSVEISADLKVGTKILVFDRSTKNAKPREATITRMGRMLLTAKDASNPSWNTWTFNIASQRTKSGFQWFRTVQQHQFYQARIAALKNLREHGLEISREIPDLHLFAVSKLITELDDVVAEVEDTCPVVLDHIHNEDGVTYDFDALRDHFRRAIRQGLPQASGNFEGWRRMSVEQLADWFADLLTAGVTPTLSNESVAMGSKVVKQILDAERAKAGA